MRSFTVKVLSLLFLSCAISTQSLGAGHTTTFAGNTQRDEDLGVVLIGAGDIAGCLFNASRQTARLLRSIDGTVFTTGDNVYQRGTAKEFRNCYEPTWGRYKQRTRPSPGNHDYSTKDATPYFEYFGAQAGPPGLGYYSYDIGAWHILSLNSNVAADESSAQMRWLREDLSRSRHKCTLAYWHHPVFASSMRGNNPRMKEIYSVLHAYRVDVVVNGHEHYYERFAPMDANGSRDEVNGIRVFIVGTGGGLLGIFGKRHPLSEIGLVEHGVIKFTLKNESYEWEFVPAQMSQPGDSGVGVCH